MILFSRTYWGVFLLLAMCLVFTGNASAWQIDEETPAWLQIFKKDRQAGLVLLRTQLNSAITQERIQACDALRLAQDYTAVPALISACNDPSEKVRERAVQTLRAFNTQEALTQCRAMLANESAPAVTRALLITLAERGVTEDAELLRPFLSSPLESVQVCAAYGLLRLGNQEGTAILDRALESPLPLAQSLATLALGYRSDAAGQKQFQTLLQSKNWPWQAELAIAQIAQTQDEKDDAQQLGQLEALAQSGPARAAEWAVLQLAKIPETKQSDMLYRLAKGSGPGKAQAQLCLLFSQNKTTPSSPLADTNTDEKHFEIIHQAIVRSAFSLLTAQAPQDEAAYDATAKEQIIQGSYDEDRQNCDNSACSGGGTIPCRSVNRHFYNPLTGGGLPSVPLYNCDSGEEDSALTSAYQHWTWLETAWTQEALYDYNGAFHLLGQIMHLLGDMSVPAHVHVDNHLDTNGDQYEKWIRTQYESSLSLPSVTAAPKTPDTANLQNFMDEMALFTYNLSAFDAVLVQDPDKQQNHLEHELGDMFELAFLDGFFCKFPLGSA